MWCFQQSWPCRLLSAAFCFSFGVEHNRTTKRTNTARMLLVELRVGAREVLLTLIHFLLILHPQVVIVCVCGTNETSNAARMLHIGGGIIIIIIKFNPPHAKYLLFYLMLLYLHDTMNTQSLTHDRIPQSELPNVLYNGVFFFSLFSYPSAACCIRIYVNYSLRMKRIHVKYSIAYSSSSAFVAAQ